MTLQVHGLWFQSTFAFHHDILKKRVGSKTKMKLDSLSRRIFLRNSAIADRGKKREKGKYKNLNISRTKTALSVREKSFFRIF